MRRHRCPRQQDYLNEHSQPPNERDKMMNTEDADAIHFMEIASHLGYLGYTVTSPPSGAIWYTASHPTRWKFAFTRWRNFLWLRCVVDLPEGISSDSEQGLECVNRLRIDSRIVSYHLANDDGEHVIEASAFLPIAYDRKAFGEWMLLWIEETSRITAAAFLEPLPQETTP